MSVIGDFEPMAYAYGLPLTYVEFMCLLYCHSFGSMFPIKMFVVMIMLLKVLKTRYIS